MATKKYLSSLKVGDKVKFGTMYGEKIKWIIAEKNHTGYPSNSVTLLTEKHIATLAFDAAEPYAENDNMQWYGRGRYKLSNIQQWLNAKAAKGKWYYARHSADHAPDRGYVNYDPYTDRFAGFLNEWDPQEWDMLMDTTREIPTPLRFSVVNDTITEQIFLPTDLEYGNATSASGILEWLRDKSNRVTTLTQDAVDHAYATAGRTLNTTDNYKTLTASGDYANRHMVYHVSDSGSFVTEYAYESAGIRPACNIPSNTLITSEPDDDGYYTVVVNYAPTEPSPIRVNYEDEGLGGNTVRSGKAITVSWGRSTDRDNNFDHYELERKYGSGDYEVVYSGTGREFEDVAKYGETTVTYRVRAVDYYDLTSGYVASTTLTIWSNEPPSISTGESLGTFEMTGPTVEFTYSDPDAGNLSLTVYLDGKEIRSRTLAATAEAQTGSMTFDSDEWLKVQNGEHTLRFLVSDGHNEQASATTTFTKAVPKILFQRMNPIEATEAPTELLLRVNGEYPENDIKVEVTNNAYDDAPVWEDMTSAFLNEDIYTFANAAKTAELWAVDFRIEIVRGQNTGDIYVESVTCNFLAGESSTSGRIGRGAQYTTEDNDAGGQTLTIEG